jgi:tripartite-type tricarboxylate transporter receptor subunit TctC
MSMRSRRKECVALVVACTCLLGPGAGHAQSVEEFYRGKTVNMIIGYPPGGSNDVYARTVARHIGKHIPGNPNVVPRNMPGAGSLVAANHIFNVAPKDGTVLGLVAPTAPLEEKLGAPNIKFKASEFNWIGRVAPGVNITFVMGRSPVKTIKDAFEKVALLGASGRSSTVAIYPSVLNNVVGTKFRLVLGYEGSVAAMLAMERGEVDGHSTSIEAVRSVHPDWLSERKVNVLVQYALKRHPEFPDVPTSVELGRNPEEVQILRVVANATEVGKLVLSPPGQPAERVTALRRAFDATVRDPEFAAELKAMRVDLGPMPGEELQKLVEEVGSVSPAIIDKVKAIYPLN